LDGIDNGWKPRCVVSVSISHAPEGRPHHLLLGLADEQANTRQIVGMAQQVIHGEAEVHLAGKLRLEFFRLRIHHDKAAQLQVIEEQIYKEIFSAYFQPILSDDEGKANTQLQEEISQMR
jgi:hypothetical protein